MRYLRSALFAMVALMGLGLLASGAKAADPSAMLTSWYKVTLELVRHTPTYSPPVASRTLGYLGVTAFEATASGSKDLQSLVGQLNGLKALPARKADASYDEAVIMQMALSDVVTNLFSNTGPTGQRVLQRLSAKLRNEAARGLAPEVVQESEAYGKALAATILDWAKEDGGAVIANMGFPLDYQLQKGPAYWVPTNFIAQQQMPLLPKWGANRTFAMPDGKSCPLPPPPSYSEEKGSEFYAQAEEVYKTAKALTPDQIAIARFWADDAMLTVTPPGHWISIAMQILERDAAPIERRVDVLARLGIAMADSFIGCWHTKFEYDLLRPVTYINRVIDKNWTPLLNTPPFPEYPSGHSTQSAAAATVLTEMFGENFAFEDRSGEKDGLKPRTFAGFWAAANEAALSRLYGGIHFRAAIERGQAQGRCVGAYSVALKTRK